MTTSPPEIIWWLQESNLGSLDLDPMLPTTRRLPSSLDHCNSALKNDSESLALLVSSNMQKKPDLKLTKIMSLCNKASKGLPATTLRMAKKNTDSTMQPIIKAAASHQTFIQSFY